jgi:competence protein ComEA
LIVRIREVALSIHEKELIMLNKKIAVLLFSCLASLSFAASAAEPSTAVNPATQVASSQGGVAAPVDLNVADAETLQQALVGIGKVKAEAIVNHRNTNGPFESVDELLEVKGIGSATLEKNRSRLVVN